MKTFEKNIVLKVLVQKPSEKNRFEVLKSKILQEKIVLIIWSSKSFEKKSIWRLWPSPRSTLLKLEQLCTRPSKILRLTSGKNWVNPFALICLEATTLRSVRLKQRSLCALMQWALRLQPFIRVLQPPNCVNIKVKHLCVSW